MSSSPCNNDKPVLLATLERRKEKTLSHQKPTRTTSKLKVSAVTHHTQPRRYYAQKSLLLIPHHCPHQHRSQWRSHKQLSPPPIAKNQSTHLPMHVMPATRYCRIATMQEYSSHHLARSQSQPIALSLQYITTRLRQTYMTTPCQQRSQLCKGSCCCCLQKFTHKCMKPFLLNTIQQTTRTRRSTPLPKMTCILLPWMT